MGIMITNSSYQTVRPAEMRDLHMIAEILEKPMKDATIVTRGFQDLEEHVENFIVFCIDEDVVGCCELLPFNENQAVELGSLAIKETHRNRGIGKRLVQAAIEQAIRQHRKLIFALSTGEGHLFRGLGFTPLPPNQLPDQKRESYDFSGSTIYGKFLRNDAS
jgi:amino-acid N-acetyltransferase